MSSIDRALTIRTNRTYVGIINYWVAEFNYSITQKQDES